MVRASTVSTLLSFHTSSTPLSSALEQSLASDPIAPVLAAKHLLALDRRLAAVLGVVRDCVAAAAARGCSDGAWRVLRQCAARPGGGWWQLLLPWKKCTSYVWKKWLALKYFLLVFGSKIFYNTRQSWLTDVLGTCVRQTLLYIKFSPNMMPMRHNLHHSAVSE